MEGLGKYKQSTKIMMMIIWKRDDDDDLKEYQSSSLKNWQWLEWRQK